MIDLKKSPKGYTIKKIGGQCYLYIYTVDPTVSLKKMREERQKFVDEEVKKAEAEGRKVRRTDIAWKKNGVKQKWQSLGNIVNFYGGDIDVKQVISENFDKKRKLLKNKIIRDYEDQTGVPLTADEEKKVLKNSEVYHEMLNMLEIEETKMELEMKKNKDSILEMVEEKLEELNRELQLV